MLAEHSNVPFFAGRAAERLVAEGGRTPMIERYLAEDQAAVARLAADRRVLVDVGCSAGRYLDLAIELGIEYLGVDISSSLVARGRLRVERRGISSNLYRFVIGDAGGLSRVLVGAGLGIHSRDTIIIFGFSALSALDDLESVAESLRRLDMPFAATLYETTAAATAMRLDYYRHCGLEPVTIERDDRGVWLCTADYRTLAPWRSYLIELFQRHGLSVRIEPMSELGFVCISDEK
jgi:SAM-dependent methyltransferase